MRSEVTIEITIPVHFQPDKGYPATRWEPGVPAHINDIGFDTKTVLDLIDKALSDPEIEAELLDEAEQARDEAEYEAEQMRNE